MATLHARCGPRATRSLLHHRFLLLTSCTSPALPRLLSLVKLVSRDWFMPPLAAGQICKSQESKLAVLWTVGIFSLNCGPVIMGFVLDFLGPKFTGILGAQQPKLLHL